MDFRFVQRAIAGTAGAALGAFLLIQSGVAQQVSPEQEAEKADTRRSEFEASIRAANEASEALADQNCPQVSYAEILSDPDNIALNVCFARTQLERGDVRGAAATLERILLIAPNALEVRYYYALALFRLDSIDEAEREFQAVAAVDGLPPKVRKEVGDYLAEIERRRQRTKHSVLVGLGTYYDTNRNSAPASGELEAAGVRAPITNAEDREKGMLGILTILSYDFTHDPGFQNQHEIFGGVDLYADTLTEQSRLDVHAATFDVGMRLRYPNFTFSPRAFIRTMRLDWAKFYQSEGLELRVDHKHKLTGLEDLPRLDTFASFTIQDEDYHNTPNFGTLTLRSGNKYTTMAGAGMRVDPDHYVRLVGTAEFKTASPDGGNSDARIYSYKDYRAEASHTWLLGGEHYLLSSLMMGVRQYKASDALVVGATGEKRIEQPFRVRMTYGMPLVDLIGDDYLQQSVNINDSIQEFLNETNLSFSGEYNYVRSNITNFQYDSARVSVLLTRKLDF